MIKLENVSVDIAIHNSETLSLRKLIFGKRPKPTIINVLKNINLEIKNEERVGLWGENGSGKTSLLRCIAGAYPPSTGKIIREGKIVNLIDIGLGIDAEATGLKNIKLKLGLENPSKMKDSKVIQSIIEFSELGKFIHYPVRTYSTGMVMRLSFSIMMHLDADIILMDEWLSVGDEGFNHKAGEKLKELIKKSKILVMASHNRNLLNDVCTKIVNLENGQIISVVRAND